MNPRIDPHVFDALQANAGADFVAELVTTFATEATLLLDELRAAQQAGAAERYKWAAHSIKSNATTFGAERLAACARELELGGIAADAVTATAAADALQRELHVTLTTLRALVRH